MNESEARKKWCPMIRYIDVDGQPINNRPDKLNMPHDLNPVGDCGYGFCIASECMAWRWVDQQTVGDVVDWMGENPGKNHEDCPVVEPTNGYCGLAK